MNGERIAFENWLGIKPCGAAHDLAWAAWKARAYLPAPQQATPEPVGEPWGWAVNSTLFRGEFAEADAKAEAKRCGGTTRAVALYTHPAPAASDVIAMVRERHRGTKWGKAAECICDAVDEAIIALRPAAQEVDGAIAASLGDIVAVWDQHAPSEYMSAMHMQAKRALAGQQPMSPDMHGWCAYVGGMVAHWVKSDPKAIERLGDDGFEAAIAGIIERRLWAMPKPACPATAASVSVSVSDEQIAAFVKRASTYGVPFVGLLNPGGTPSDFSKRFTAEILSLRPAQAGVPEGWKLVPVEPTPEMKSAGINVEVYSEVSDSIGALTWAEVDAIYRAMLAAAPKEGGAA